MIIIPKKRWVLGTLNTPFRMGTIKRPKPPNVRLTVDDETGNWLVLNGYAEIVDQELPTDSITDEENPEEAIESSTETESILTPSEPTTNEAIEVEAIVDLITLEEWQISTLEFLNSSDSATILNSLKGIGPRKVEELIKVKPLTWEKVSSTLNERQMQTLEVWANGNSIPSSSGS